MDEIDRLGVIGAGQMGGGIAQVAATSGMDVLLRDVSEERLEAARQKIRHGLARAAEKGAVTSEQGDAALARIRMTVDLKDFASLPLVIEAAPEERALKIELFRKLGELCKPDTVLASNTSSISITALGAAASRPERVVGIHFMNPVPAMRLVEVVRGLRTSDETVNAALALADRLGKTAIVSKDAPGFIVNRVLMPLINEAIFVLQEGIGSAEAIDQGLTAGANLPVGPLALADRIGLDTVLAICQTLYEDLGDPKFRPCPLLRTYVEAGWLGRKSGRGFYPYGANP